MAKKRKSSRARRPAEARPSESRTSPSPPAAAEPVFWFGFEVSWAKLVSGRWILFGLLAIDALLQIPHAPRYGAGGFNVAQLAGLDALAPTRSSYGIAELINAYLFVLAACGLATRVVLPIATVIYAWLYFGSQLDSYQHHYLVSLILLIACFVPWQRPDGAKPETPIRTWAIRLLLVQLAIMYGWAAISKMNATWVSGATLTGQLSGKLRSLIDATIGIRGASCVVLVTEVVLAATIWWPRAWRVTAVLGIGLHVGILFSHLEIGLFAWLMLGLYVWVLPDRVWIWLATTSPARGLGRAIAAIVRWTSGARAAAAVPLGLVLLWLARYHHAFAVGALLTFALIALFVVGDRRRLAGLALAHLLALLLWVTIDRTGGVAPEYYRLWGGTARRLGDRDGEEQAYRGMLALAPDDATAHYHLGSLLLSRDATDEALDHLHRAEELAPSNARAFVAEARWLLSHGKRDEALAKARAAAQADPGDRDARALIDGTR